MIPFVPVRLLHQEIEMKPDSDGEMRVLLADAVLELDMKLYEEQHVELLSDMYSTGCELVLDTGTACFDRLFDKRISANARQLKSLICASRSGFFRSATAQER